MTKYPCNRQGCPGTYNSAGKHHYCSAACKWAADQSAKLTTRLMQDLTEESRTTLETRSYALNDIQDGLDKWAATFR